WNVPQYLARSRPVERQAVLESTDYAIFDENEQVVQWLGEMARKVDLQYKGDLSNLRERAGQNRDQERALIMEFDGMGPLQADVFQREAQVGWCETMPFLGSRAESAARKLGLPEDRIKLMLMAGSLNLPRLGAALDRVAREKNQEEILMKAHQLERV
ncbi:MAG: hypothetical protein ACYC5N_06040, partial [Endomicrobiales bacterium]